MLTPRLLALQPEDIAAALSAWHCEYPGCGIFALLAEADREKLPILQAACRHEGVPLAGGVVPALIDGATFQSAGVWLLPMNPAPPCVLMPIESLPSHTAMELYGKLQGFLLPERAGVVPPVLFLLFDGMIPNIASILTSLYGRAGKQVRYAGLNVGSRTFQPIPCLFDGERVMEQGVLALLLPPETRFAVSHGFPVARHRRLLATSITGNRIDQIDHRPAFEVYQEIVRETYGVELTTENFYEYAVHFTLGVVLVKDMLIRIPVSLNDDGALHCIGEVPPNSLLHVLQAPDLEKSSCIADITQNLTDVRKNRHAPALTFYCEGRHLHLGEDASEELRQLQAAQGAQPLFGALSLGEIGSDVDLDFPRFHNAAVVCVR